MSVTHKHYLNDFIEMKVQEIKVFAANVALRLAATELFFTRYPWSPLASKVPETQPYNPCVCCCIRTYWWQVNLISGSISENGREHSFDSLNVGGELSNVHPEELKFQGNVF